MHIACMWCRINFTLEDLAPASPAYEFFRQCLDMTYTTDSARVKFEIQQVPLSYIAKFSDYERNQEMVSPCDNGLESTSRVISNL